ncbi:MAG: hypothetical protein ACI3Y0_08775 [Prevotella sp.]
MCVYNIKFSKGRKTMHLVKSREEYLRLRDGGNQIANVSKARNGNEEAKRKLVQMNYSCLPAPGGFLKGAKRESNSVGMDIDLKPTPNHSLGRGEEVKPTPDPSLGRGEEAALVERILSLKDELGLLMLERSATKGFHMVFRRRTEMSQEENLEWASSLVGVEYDKGAKDITRVFYTTTASPEDLLYLNDDLFTGGEPATAAPAPSVAAPAAAAPVAAAPAESSSQQPSCSGCQPAVSQQSPSSPSKPQPEEGYHGFTWKQIIAKYFDLFNNGKEPKEGNRNTLTFELTQALSPLVDYNADRLLAIVPRYDSLPEQEWRTTVTNAAQKRWKTIPRRTRQVLNELNNEALKNLLGGSALLPPEMPQKLPPVLKLLTSKVPEPYKACVAEGVFPALAAHLHDVKFRYIDNTEREATLMALLIAPMSTGKSSVNLPIKKVMADIEERDKISREREMEWKRRNPSAKSKPRDPRPDDICIQILSSDLTNAAFNQRMIDADRNGHRYLFLKTDELESMKSVTSQRNMQQLSVVVRNAFDNAEHGQERVGADSVTGKAPLRFNFHTSATPPKAKQLLGGSAIDGTLSRLSLSTIIKEQTAGAIPKYGIYDDKFDAALKPFIDTLNRANGFYECRQLDQLIEQMIVENQDNALQFDSEGYELLARRASVIAFSKGMVLYILNGRRWSKDIADYVQWSLRYDMWCKMKFFGSIFEEELDKENKQLRSGVVNIYDLLPDTFSLEEYQKVRMTLGKTSDGKETLRQWRRRKQIELDEIANVYVKTKRSAA